MKMNAFSLSTARRLCGVGVTTLLTLSTHTALALSPLAPPSLVGKYPVACSNVEQDFTRLATGQSPPDYWEGNPNASGNRYVTDLLVNPDKALTYTVKVPTSTEIDVFEKQGGKQLPYAAIACYPTTADNARADYILPGGAKVPRMERGNDTALIAGNPDAADGKWPLIVLSHGLAGSPLGDNYAQVIVRLAQEGYVVYAPFHADARFSRIKLEDASDYFYVVSKYSEIAEMQAIRPIGLKQGLDNLLARAEYTSKIDADRIAGFGASLGGMAMMLAQGSKMTTSLGGAERTITRDNRYKALVGYVPFSGYSFQPAFGDSNQGVKSVRVPYLGIGGTADIVAPISRTSQMIEALGGSKYFVTIQDMPHGLRAQDAPELFGWTFGFLKAHLSRDQADRTAFDQIANFAGNADDRVQIRKTLAWGSRDEWETVEYFAPSTGRYFLTPVPEEITLLDQYPTIWPRTGQRFVTLRKDAPLGVPVCRFWMTDGTLKVNSHFYSATRSDCDIVRPLPWMVDQGDIMKVWESVSGLSSGLSASEKCPDDTSKVFRMYNNRTVNHRYITEELLSRSTFTGEWTVERVAFCAAKYDR
jgi:predicted dienelactone hydrolase